MKVKEALEITVNTLSAICVPVGLMQVIGEPIATAIGNLTACIEAIRENEEGKAGENEHTDAG